MEKNKNQIKTKFIKKYILSFLLMIIFASCSTYKYEITPEKKNSHRMIRLKIHYKDSKNKYSGKIIILRKDEKKKIFILNPLGRVHFKLILNGEKTTAIYIKKKKYWDGTFLTFIKKLWGVQLSFEDFYQMVVSGKISTYLKNNDSIQIKVTKDKNNLPKTIIITRGSIYLKLKVLKNIVKAGKIDFTINKDNIKKVNLDRLIDR